MGFRDFYGEYMSITSKTRKLLWGRSGDKCSICGTQLSHRSDENNDTVLGEECHIYSSQAKGPRHDPTKNIDDYDGYDNLILLCSAHHKIIDDQVEEYPPQKLQKIKQKHIASIQEKLNGPKEIKPVKLIRLKKNIPEFLQRITNGSQLCNIINGSFGTYTHHDELHSVEEVELVGGFFQEVQDWVDLFDIFEPIHKVRGAFDFSKMIGELEKHSLAVFGGIEIQILTGGINDSKEPIPVLILWILRSDNQLIVRGEASEFARTFDIKR